MKPISHAVAFALAVAALAPARPAVGKPASEQSTPTLESLAPEQQRPFQLALAYAEKTESGLDYQLAHFALTARDAATGVQTVSVYGTPKKGSKWHCASVSFKVLVDSDGKVSEPQWNPRYCW